MQAIDYRLPGSKDYFNFLVTQVIPYVDNNYLSDTSDRTLSGHSFGGLFVGTAVLLEDPNDRYFKRYLSQDGSFWFLFDETVQLNDEPAAATDSLPVTIVVTGARGASGNHDVAFQYHSLLINQGYTDINLNFLDYPVGHIAEFLLSMEETLELFY